MAGAAGNTADDPSVDFDSDLPAPVTSGKDGAAGTPGGGAAGGGLAGANYGHGDPLEEEIEAEMQSGRLEDEEAIGVLSNLEGGPSGGAVGGTPAGKRSRRPK